MEEILFLAHRLPYPPNKGDKIRSFHILRHLAQRYRVHLGTFVDAPEDEQHVPMLRGLCGGQVCAARLRPRWALLRSLGGLLDGRPLTEAYYRDKRVAGWVSTLLRERPVRRAVVFSSSMAQYLSGAAQLRRVLDLVDVDSEKWRQYALVRRWPAAALYRREAARLLVAERRAAGEFSATLLVSEQEAQLFRALAPEVASRVRAMSNGVDTDHFDPAIAYPDPYQGSGGRCMVFTGAMDYWPNVDAVCWFADAVLPRVLQCLPEARFFIVGRDPARAVRQLARHPGVIVTGGVADVRPYLAHAGVAVAPLRLARGIQNKVLEAMAMARPVIASPQALEGLSVRVPEDVRVATDPQQFSQQVVDLLTSGAAAAGQAARRAVVRDYAWDSCLQVLDRLLECPEPADNGKSVIRPGQPAGAM